MSTVLALDIGKTGCRAALVVDGDRGATVEGAGARGLAESDGVASALEAVGAVAASVVGAGSSADDLRAAVDRGAVSIDAVAVGLAGLASAPGRADELGAAVAGLVGARRVVLASDMTASHLGALEGAPGVVVAAGTGAVALAVAVDGQAAVVDGWGYLVGDDGSGHAIGRRGLAAALRAHDGRTGSEALRLRARDRFGDLGSLSALVHGAENPARVIASFTPDVLAAAREGDPWCRGVWADAGRELARSAAAAAHRIDQPDGVVAATGGLLEAGDLLVDPLREELLRLLPGAELRPAAGDALHGALLMATRDDLPHAHLLHHHRGAPA